jgi:hypothetical protein
MSGWHELDISRKSSFIIFFVQYDLLRRSGIFPGRAGRPVRAGASYARPGCFIERLRGHPALRKLAIDNKFGAGDEGTVREDRASFDGSARDVISGESLCVELPRQVTQRRQI